jgi:hypothetical protein
MKTDLWPQERRHEPRIYLGVPVRVHIEGEQKSQSLELMNVSTHGCYFQTAEDAPHMNQWVAFGFVDAERSVCAARGRVIRRDEAGFALSLESTNSAFQGFVSDISGPYLIAA